MTMAKTRGDANQAPAELVSRYCAQPPVVIAGIIKQDFGTTRGNSGEAANIHQLFGQVAMTEAHGVAYQPPVEPVSRYRAEPPVVVARIIEEYLVVTIGR